MENTFERKIFYQVKTALADHFYKQEKETIEAFEILKVLKRPFSTIAFLEIRTSHYVRRLVIKTTAHHPINRTITERENQAVVEFNILDKVCPRFKEMEKCSVPQPILVLPEIESFVMEYVEGYLLSDELRYARYFSPNDKFRVLCDYHYHCGRWLKHFQLFTGMRAAGLEAFNSTLERCEEKLKLIEQSGGKHCPHDLRKKVMAFLGEQLRRLEGEKILVTGRHGDFGPWNILVSPQGVTVLDFLGYQEDPLPVDFLKMLMNFEDGRRYLAYSKSRIDILKDSFLEGFGELPEVPAPVLAICEVLHRVSSVYGCVSVREERLHRRIERYLCLKANLEWLISDKGKRYLWPRLS